MAAIEQRSANRVLVDALTALSSAEPGLAAALQTKMAIAVYSSDRELFEEVVRYAAAGSGNGSIPNWE